MAFLYSETLTYLIYSETDFCVDHPGEDVFCKICFIRVLGT